MNNDLKSLWEKTLNIIKGEMSEVSFNTWIKSCEPISISSNTIKISVPNSFTQDILEKRYKDLVVNSIEAACSKLYNVDFIVASDIQEAEEKEEKNSKIDDKSSVTVNDEMSSTLNPKYTFDSFVIGNSNRFAHAASLAVAEAPAKAYNPLFIYGGVGLGKTHLMHAIGHYALQNNSNAKVVYVSSEKFTNELHDAYKHIILSSDRPPKEIPTLEDRLRSRFEWGLIADIQPPDFETRMAILKKKADVEKLNVANEVMVYIATKIKSNIRELEGALIRIVAYSSLTNRPITVELASEALKDIISNKQNKNVTIDVIQDVVAAYFNLRVEDLKSQRRTRNVAYPRQIAMYLSRKLTDMSLPKIGEEFGGRDHTTVIHAYEKISDTLNTDESLQHTVNDITKKLTQN